jgi:Putative phage tail protein
MIFTAAATALLAGTALASSTFAVGALAFGLQIGASVALNYAAKALAGNKEQPAAARADHFSAQGTLQAGGDIPRSFNLGFSMTAGSLVYANTWGQAGETPNAYFTQVISVSDLPGGALQQVWVNGELVTLDPTAHPSLGNPALEYRKDGQDHLWVKYYDGTQTGADAHLVINVSSLERPYNNTRVGYGIAYAICTALVEDTLFTGFPTYKFAVSGLPLYDPSKDSTIGGSGSHRWSDPATWGGDGDNLPAVQIYNILRGISYGGKWVYGLQSMTAARLPTVNWISQIAKCREAIPTAAGGVRPTYRSGLQVNVDTQPANAIEVFLTACQGRVSEIGGFYKIHLGAPGSPTFAFTDADILSTEAQNFAPFFPLADSINGITATYPNPLEGWSQKAAPPHYRSDLEARDGNRRLLANPSFDAVWDSEQVQHLMKSALEEAQRARRHAMVMPPAFWLVEPGDVGEWTSVRNGYDGKLFRVDGVIDEPNLDVSWNITEVDPSDYSWDPDQDYEPIYSGPTTFPRPEPQGIVDWYAEPYVIKDNEGYERRPAIRLSWDGDMPGVVGILYEVRFYDTIEAQYEIVTRGRSDQLDAGAIIISHNLLPNTLYGVRGQYIPSAPRDMLWSDWLAVTTLDVKQSIKDFNASLKNEVTKIFGNDVPQLIEAVKQNSLLLQQALARTGIDKKELRTQLQATAGNAKALVEQLSLVVADNELAFAQFQTTVSATFGPSFSTVNTVSEAVATLDGYAATRYSVTLDVNGYATGFTLINAGNGVSSTTFLTTNFQIATVGPGGSAVPIFQTAFVNGVPKIALRADVYADGSITAGKLSVAYLSSLVGNVGELTAGLIRSTDNRMRIDLDNARIEIWS